jgi:3-oxoacyl-[acyl-carrier protein] reductase
VPKDAAAHESRRVLITGSTRGIGAAIAAAFAQNGDVVAVHGRSKEAAADVAASLVGAGHAGVTGDIGEPEGAQAVVAGAVAALGGIDVLVNNAGVYRELPIATTSYAEWQEGWREVLGVNLIGTANVIWCVVDHLLHRAEGPAGARIVTVGSRGGYRGEPVALAYGASKSGVHKLTQSLAVTLAPHDIAVSAVAPGFVRTDMAETRLAGPDGDSVRAESPYNRVGEPEEIAAGVLWLASPEAIWASGSVLDLNGASYLR